MSYRHLFALLLTLAALPAAAASPADQRQCQTLIMMFDGMDPEQDKTTARRDRLLGEAECRKGNWKNGVALLEEAIYAAGFVPPSSL